MNNYICCTLSPLNLFGILLADVLIKSAVQMNVGKDTFLTNTVGDHSTYTPNRTFTEEYAPGTNIKQQIHSARVCSQYGKQFMYKRGTRIPARAGVTTHLPRE
jgi:hypothetical protein